MKVLDHPWPSRSPDLSLLDYWFSLLNANVKEVKMIVEEFAVSLQSAEIRKCVSYMSRVSSEIKLSQKDVKRFAHIQIQAKFHK